MRTSGFEKWMASLAELMAGTENRRGSAVRAGVCGYVIHDVARYLKEVSGRGGDAGQARVYLDAAEYGMAHGEDTTALLKARAALRLAKSALCRDGHELLYQEGEGLMAAVDTAMSVFARATW